MKRVLVALVLAACSGAPGGPSMNNKITPDAEKPVSSVVSSDILAREAVSNSVSVKHILIGWKDLGDAYQGRIDQRAAKRSKKDAEDEVKTLLAQLKGGADFDTLMKANSEDPSSVNGHVFDVTPSSSLVIEFRLLSLRLKPGEMGVCESDYGFHIIKRLN
jgi:peptidyl-prolyl cis-trans isomerase C